MPVLNPDSEDEAQECPLCMEFLELEDLNFYPCSCGYQICGFCWNKIRTEGSGLCPACRSPYAENPADFKPLTAEELAKIKAEKRQKDQAKKQKVSENRKHLANVRVVQRNLVFVVGLSHRLADPDILKKPEYFGKFGKIHKVVINHSTSYAGNQNQGPSASAFVTYYKSEDALRAIQAVNNVFIDGRTLKASLGTTKYCSHFMKNQNCPKHDCMYLHEIGDSSASFSKEEMLQGKHTDFERTLHEEMVMRSSAEPSDRGDDVSKKEKQQHSRSPSPRVSAAASNCLPTESVQQQQQQQQGATSPDRNGAEDRISLEEIPEENVRSRAAPETQQLPAAAACDSNELEEEEWARSRTSSSTPDFLEDDLGFDPFHETQKALSEMLESESKLLEINSVPMSRVEERLGEQMHTTMFPSSQPFIQLQPLGRPKAPPPGFSLASNIHPSLHQRHIEARGFEAMNSQLDQPFSNHDFGVNSHFGNASPGPSRPFEKNSFYSSSSAGGGSNTSWHGKDWQEGLRALLPNVNVSFGNLPTNYQQTQQQVESLPPNANFQPFVREDRELNSSPMPGGWRGANAGGKDWTLFDPAIVGGQLANNRVEYPSNWIKTHMEQLSSESQVLPDFSNMAISSNGGRSFPSQQWGGAANMSGAPPPGFAMNRGQLSHSFQDSEHFIMEHNQ